MSPIRHQSSTRSVIQRPYKSPIHIIEAESILFDKKISHRTPVRCRCPDCSPAGRVMQYRSWLLHDGLTYYRLIRESENNMPARQSVSNYPSLPARNQNTPLPSTSIATDTARAHSSFSSAKQFVPPLPAALQVPVMKVVSSVKDIAEGDRLLRYLKDALEGLQSTSLKGQHTCFQSSDFSTISHLLPALGQRLPQLLSNVQQLDNKTEWLRSVLRSLFTVIECCINLLREKDAEISDLEDRMSIMEERLTRIEGRDSGKSVRKEARKLP
ncbi:hypothetical protein C351_05977 [Cryptococcus neoformans c8]|nr:hypothetical protein C353_01860 [Cryptococcus neoformans var. grubii AD1-83a]OXG58424.1 hypothetical protein C351_05977 [Cryptococcus neoformans var. grubii c8]OXG64690.1 hypothetical protein C354_01873 [Cryptococcus neoformans var. grubii MW-RSA1955]OXH02604.1 hypothetical protein C369_06257 [Cryptococcus neoformans var. grubii A5-35-17]OXH04150.1 hypothetical protein C370_06326 [Cryptococcus neoformans var. grubii A1-35-8]